MDLLFLFLTWLAIGIISFKFGLDELKIFTIIVELLFGDQNTTRKNYMTDAESLEKKLNNLNLDSETRKMVLKESQDNYNYSVEGRRAENTRLLAMGAIVVSMIAGFYTLLTHIRLAEEPFAKVFALLTIFIFVISCFVAISCLFRAMLCEYGAPPSTVDKIKELENICASNKNNPKADFENSLSASNAAISYKNVQSNIEKGKYLGMAVKSIKSALWGMVLLAFELGFLKLYPIFCGGC